MVHFFSPPYTSEQALAKAKELTSKVAGYAGSINFIQVPFTKVQETIKEKVPEGAGFDDHSAPDDAGRTAAAITLACGDKGVFTGESLTGGFANA